MGQHFLRIDLYAAALLLGVVQGFFLTLLFLLRRPHRQPYHNLLLAALVASFASVILEIFLCYSGLMFRTLPLVDFSEPLNFALGPVTYLLLRSLCGKDWEPKQWLHFLPFAFYSLYRLSFLLQPEAVKYNAYINAYFPRLPQLDVAYTWNPDPLYLSQWVNEMTLVHITAYVVAAFLHLRASRQSQRLNTYFYSWSRMLLFFYAATILLFLLLKLTFEQDLGDHLIAVFMTGQLFFISYKMLTGSAFFRPVVQVKYEKSALSEEAKQSLLQRLRAAEEQKFFVQPSASLPGLASQLHTSPHYLSQSLNECLGKSFFEYLAELRVQEAQHILSNPTLQHLKIEEVAEQTGYLSKSAFSSAFKKQTGLTPGQFRKNSSSVGASL